MVEFIHDEAYEKEMMMRRWRKLSKRDREPELQKRVKKKQ